jgi:glycosyltransferase involved in cell wall biosynthesis
VTVHTIMMVRNESGRFLEKALRSAWQIQYLTGGSIIITDDASDDDTAEICKRWTRRVQTSDAPMFWEHEGRARQRHLDYAAQFMSPGDWVLSLDADETINDPEKLVRATKQARPTDVAIGLPLYEFWSTTQYRTDGLWFGAMASRLFRWQEGARILDKGMGCGSEPTYVQDAVARGRWLKQSDAHLLHWGYLRVADRERKYLRYTQRLGGHGHNNNHVASIIAPRPDLARYPDDAALL